MTGTNRRVGVTGSARVSAAAVTAGLTRPTERRTCRIRCWAWYAPKNATWTQSDTSTATNKWNWYGVIDSLTES